MTQWVRAMADLLENLEDQNIYGSSQSSVTREIISVTEGSRESDVI